MDKSIPQELEEILDRIESIPATNVTATQVEGMGRDMARLGEALMDGDNIQLLSPQLLIDNSMIYNRAAKLLVDQARRMLDLGN